MANFKHCISSSWKWASSYIRFSKAAIFISGLIFSKSFIEIAFKAFLISYIIDTRKNISIGAAIAYAAATDGIQQLLVILIHHLATDRHGYFRVIILTFPCLIFGLLILWLSSLLLSQQTSNQMLYIALPVILVGLAGEDVSLEVFLRQHFVEETIAVDKTKSERQQSEEYKDIVEGRASLWSNGAGFLGQFICWTFASSLSWKKTIMVSFIEVAAAYALFICGKRYYLRIPPTRRTAVSQLKEAKGLVKLIPLWLLFIPYCLAEVAGFSIFILQSYRLDTRINPRISLHNSFNKVPVNSLYVFKQFISFLVSMSTKYLIRKLWSSEEAMQRGARYWRMGVGMAVGFGSLLSAWLVERRRSDLIKKNPNDDEDIPMTILWLAPQFGLLGIANGLVLEGLTDFFYDRVPESKQYFEVLFNHSLTVIGSFLSGLAVLLAPWFGDTIDECQLDKYLLMLAILNVAVLPLYIFLSLRFDWNMPDEVDGRDIEIEEVDGSNVEILMEEVDGRDVEIL